LAYQRASIEKEEEDDDDDLLSLAAKGWIIKHTKAHTCSKKEN